MCTTDDRRFYLLIEAGFLQGASQSPLNSKRSMPMRTGRSASGQCNSCSRRRIGRVATLLSCLALGRASILTGRGRHPGAFVHSIRPTVSTRPLSSFTANNHMVSNRAAAWYDRFLYVVMDRRGPALLTRRDSGVFFISHGRAYSHHSDHSGTFAARGGKGRPPWWMWEWRSMTCSCGQRRWSIFR
jgi:hypothetical protein